MLMPKRVKRRKQFRGSMKGKALRGNKITNGEYGLVAMEPCWIRSNQIEAARIAMTRYIKRGGKVWIKIFPDKPVTTKPAETRMGSGKGTLEYWVAVVKPGRVMFELAGVPEEVAKEALRLAMHKLPFVPFHSPPSFPPKASILYCLPHPPPKSNRHYRPQHLHTDHPVSGIHNISIPCWKYRLSLHQS